MLVTAFLIAALAFAEAAVAWHYLSVMYKQGSLGRITQHESELQNDTTELDRIMLFRDAENHRSRSDENRDVLGTHQGASTQPLGPTESVE